MQQTPFTPLGQTTPAFPGTYPPTQRPSLPKLLLSFLPVDTNTFSSSSLLLSSFSCLCPFSSSSTRRSPPTGLCGALPLTWPAGGLLLLMLRFLLFIGFPLIFFVTLHQIVWFIGRVKQSSAEGWAGHTGRVHTAAILPWCHAERLEGWSVFYSCWFKSYERRKPDILLSYNFLLTDHVLPKQQSGRISRHVSKYSDTI